MLELTFLLDAKSSVPLYEQIYNYIKSEIQTGVLKADQKLPSTRALAVYLQVSRSTVELAYEQLISEGYLEAVPWKGYYISNLSGIYHIETEKMQKGDEEKSEVKGFLYDFTPNGIELEHFPYATWRKINKKILGEENELFQLGNPRGERILRETICSYVHQARGVNCTPGQIIVGAGNDYLLLLLSYLLGQEHCIAMENPGYVHAFRILSELFTEVTAVETDRGGMNVERLRASKADIAYVMPSHQYPLGIVMPIKRRMELLSWAGEAKNRYIIEDDYDSEFRYKGKPIPALQGSDHRETVIYMGTFSKSIAPAIRISYLVLPDRLMKIYREKGKNLSSTVSRIDQMILNEFIIGGYLERHLNKMRGIYKMKHDTLLNALKCFEKSCRIKGENAGVHLLLEFPADTDERALTEAAAREGIHVLPLSDTFLGGLPVAAPPTLILGYAVLKESDMAEAVTRLWNLWVHRKKSDAP